MKPTNYQRTKSFYSFSFSVCLRARYNKSVPKSSKPVIQKTIFFSELLYGKKKKMYGIKLWLSPETENFSNLNSLSTHIILARNPKIWVLYVFLDNAVYVIFKKEYGSLCFWVFFNNDLVLWDRQYKMVHYVL